MSIGLFDPSRYAIEVAFIVTTEPGALSNLPFRSLLIQLATAHSLCISVTFLSESPALKSHTPNTNDYDSTRTRGMALWYFHGREGGRQDSILFRDHLFNSYPQAKHINTIHHSSRITR